MCQDTHRPCGSILGGPHPWPCCKTRPGADPESVSRRSEIRSCQDRFEGRVRQAERGCYRRVDDSSIVHIEPECERSVLTQRFLQTCLCYPEDVGQGHVRQGISGSPWDRPGHVGHTIMDYAVHLEGRIAMSGWPRCLEA